MSRARQAEPVDFTVGGNSDINTVVAVARQLCPIVTSGSESVCSTVMMAAGATGPDSSQPVKKTSGAHVSAE